MLPRFSAAVTDKQAGDSSWGPQHKLRHVLTKHNARQCAAAAAAE